MNEAAKGSGGTAVAGRGAEGGGIGRSAGVHPIGVVAARTGLTPDVLRVWERRHRVVEPVRSESGQRLYSEADVERLRLLARATAKGRNISQLVRLSESELRDLVRGDDAATVRPRSSVAPPEAGAYVALALEKANRLDGAGLESLLRRLATLWGTPAFLESLAAPLFQRVGEEWHAGRLKVAQEHLATDVMRSVLTSLRAELAPAMSAPTLLIATPVAERHEIGALLAAAAAAAEGWRVVYLGADLPAAEIARAALETHSRGVALSVVAPENADEVVRELEFLRGALPPHVAVLVGGGGATALRERLEAAGVLVVTELDALRVWLREPH